MNFGLILAVLLESTSPSAEQLYGAVLMLAGGAMAEGLVRIRGRVGSENPLSSPFTATPGCFCRVEIEENRSGFSMDSNTGSAPASWRIIYSEASTLIFSIGYASSQIPIRPKGLEVDPSPAMEREIPEKATEARDEALLDYLKRRSHNPSRKYLWETTNRALLTLERAADLRVQERLKQAHARLEPKLQRKTKGVHYRVREYCPFRHKNTKSSRLRARTARTDSF